MEFTNKYPTGAVVGNAILSRKGYNVGFVLIQNKHLYYISVVLLRDSKVLEIKTSDPFEKKQALQYATVGILNLVNRHKYTLHQHTGELQELVI